MSALRAISRHLEGRGHRATLYALALSAILVWLDAITSPYLQFPITFMLPVTLAAWFSGRRWGLVLGIVLPLIRAAHVMLSSTPQTDLEIAINAAIRIVVFCSFAVLLDSVARRYRVLEQEAAALEVLLPVCAWCKSVRMADDSWRKIEDYISARTSQSVTSGICPSCLASLKHGNRPVPPA